MANRRKVIWPGRAETGGCGGGGQVSGDRMPRGGLGKGRGSWTEDHSGRQW